MTGRGSPAPKTFTTAVARSLTPLADFIAARRRHEELFGVHEAEPRRAAPDRSFPAGLGTELTTSRRTGMSAGRAGAAWSGRSPTSSAGPVASGTSCRVTVVVSVFGRSPTCSRFDRILVAQAAHESGELLTVDAHLAGYGAKVRAV